jgi:hypothetical protein
MASAPTAALLGSIDLRSLGDDPLGELAVFASAKDGEELRARLDEQITNEVDGILASVKDLDAFDVIELVRLRELPIAPAAALNGGHDGLAAIIDIVSLVLLTQDSRMPSGKDRLDTRPHLIIDDLHNRASKLLRLAAYARQLLALREGDDPIHRLAAEYQSHLIAVRKQQYESIQSAHDAALFGEPTVDDLLQSTLGFSYQEFCAARDAIRTRYSRTMTNLRDTVADALERAEGREPNHEELERFERSIVDFMFLPGQRALFTVSDIVGDTAIDIAKIESVLKVFSVSFGELRDAQATVRRFLRGVNPISTRCLVSDGSGNYLMIGDQLGTDSFRATAEGAFKGNTRTWKRYDGVRARVSEALSIDALERLLKTDVTHRNLKYLGPKKTAQVENLSKSCGDPQQYGDQTECDGLFLIHDVAVCVEVKGRTIADAARRGDVARLKTEIGKTFGDGARQARRLEDLIQSNGGIWLDQETWLDLTGVREIRSVVVGLDIFGPLAVALGDLQESGSLSAGSLPWITSLHDLEAISKVLDRPSELLLYLRRRAGSEVATHYRGADELDLFMLFLRGGLYVEPDPDHVRRLHPTLSPVKTHLRRRHDLDSRPTLVGTLTDPLDAWVYRIEGTNPFDAPKPCLNSDAGIAEIVDFLADGKKPGWLRFGADLLGLSGQAQVQLRRCIRDMVRLTKSDGCYHEVVQGFAGTWGYPTFFAGSVPNSYSLDAAKDRLRIYIIAKKHQLQSDRSLGLLLNEHRKIVFVSYANNNPSADSELDELGEATGLKLQGSARLPVVPGSRPRPSKGRRGKKRKKH